MIMNAASQRNVANSDGRRDDAIAMRKAAFCCKSAKSDDAEKDEKTFETSQD